LERKTNDTHCHLTLAKAIMIEGRLKGREMADPSLLLLPDRACLLLWGVFQSLPLALAAGQSSMRGI